MHHSESLSPKNRRNCLADEGFVISEQARDTATLTDRKGLTATANLCLTSLRNLAVAGAREEKTCKGEEGGRDRHRRTGTNIDGNHHMEPTS